MRFTGLVFTCLFLLGVSIKGYSKSDDFTISLLTCSTGKELYSIFGHSAIRIQSDKLKKDIVYDFGIFDFNTPNFVFRFLKGDLEYRLSIRDYETFQNEYERAKRSIFEQKFNLSEKEKETIIEELRRVYDSDERYYQYNFLYNNCSTRIRDLILNADSTLQRPANSETVTFRDHLNSYLNDKPWIGFGINIILGVPTDKDMNEEEGLFLPYQLSTGLSEYMSVDVAAQDLLQQKEILYFAPEEQGSGVILTPFWIFIIIGLIGGILFFKYPKVMSFFGVILYPALGLLGIVLLFMWFGTLHDATKVNWNVLWANPIGVLYPFLGKGKFKKGFLYFTGISYILFMALWLFIPQEIPIGVLPIILLMLLFNYSQLKESGVKNRFFSFS